MKFCDFLDPVYFGFCEWRGDANLFSTPEHLHTSIFRFPARYRSIECASTQILMRKLVARDMVPESQARKRKSSNIGFTWDFHLNWHLHQIWNFVFGSVGCKLIFDSRRACTARYFVSLHFMDRLNVLADRF